MLTPVPQRTDGIPPHANTRTYNKPRRGPRCIGEHGFAVLTERWKAPEHVTVSPRRITRNAQAALTHTHFEHGFTS